MSIAAPLTDDARTARDRAEYLRDRNGAPVMSIATEQKVREATDRGDAEAAKAARAEGNARFELENQVIGSMPTAEFKALHKEATQGSHSKADKMLDAAVEAYGRERARSDAAANRIEPVEARVRSRRELSLGETTKALRDTLLERHGADAANADNNTTDRSNRERVSVDREAIARMSPDDLKAYQAARLQGPVAAKMALDETVKRMQADIDGRDAIRSSPPLEERFNVRRRLGTTDYEFRDQPGKLAFTERPFSMRTAVDHPAAVKAMVDRAMERGWSTVRVTGSSEFQRQAWIASTARGIKAVGYEPTPGDRETARRERERMAIDRSGASARSSNTLPQQAHSRQPAPAARERQVMAALDKAMRDGKVPAHLRDQLRERVSAEHARRTAQGQRVAVKVYDPTAPRPKPKVPDFAIQRSGERERSR